MCCDSASREKLEMTYQVKSNRGLLAIWPIEPAERYEHAKRCCVDVKDAVHVLASRHRPAEWSVGVLIYMVNYEWLIRRKQVDWARLQADFLRKHLLQMAQML